MDKMDKITKKIMIIGAAAVVIVFAVAIAFKMNRQSLISVIAIIWAVLMVIRMYLINGKNKEYTKMLDHLSKILTEENNPERYIEMCNTYMDRVDDEKFKAMLLINSAAGYSTQGQYDKAAQVLNTVDVSYLAESHKAILYNNLAQYSFLTEKEDYGMNYVNDNLQLLLKYLRNKNVSATFMTTFAFYYYYRGNKQYAKTYATNIIGLIGNSDSNSENDKIILEKLNELLIKINELPDEEDNDFKAETPADIDTLLSQESDEDEDVDADE